MSRERILEVVLTMLGAVLLLIAAAGKHPYGFYMVLRLVITVGAVYWAWRVYKAGLRAWTWAFVAVALLLNPFLPIRMQRAQWQPIDLCLGILLIGWSGYRLFHKQTPTSSRNGQAYQTQWPGTGASRKAGTSAGGTGASTRASIASPRGTSSARGWWSPAAPVRRLEIEEIFWTAVALLWGGGFSLAVSAPDSILGVIVVSAMAFGGFAIAAERLWSPGISKVLSKIGITTFSKRAAATVCLISLTILALNFVGSLAARSSTPETQLGTNASDTSVSSASAGCHPPVFSQQELSALKQQAASGDAAAQCGLGRMYSLGKGVPEDDAQAVLWFRKAAEQGDAHAQYDLGLSYNEGHGVPQDYAQAALWYRKAAEQGDTDAQYNLGVWYEEGEYRGVDQDTQAAFWRRKIRAWRAYINSVDFHFSEHWRFSKAAFWYRKAAEQGDAEAQYNLGRLYYDGRGVAQDYDQAALWFRAAAEQGDSDAQDELGNLYLSGEGVAQDYAQASLWYRKAAEQGDSDAQESLGDLYLHGQGMPRDYAEAYFWFDLAAAGKQDASDSKQVAKHRDEAASHLTPADLAREQERARKWFEEHQAKPQ